MTILTRYLLRELLLMTAACLAGFMALYIVIDFVEMADKLFRNNATLTEILRYYLFSIPQIFIQVSPVAVLVAVLATVSLRARAGEFTAIYSMGASPLRAFAPLVAGCALVSVLSLASSEIVAPNANRKAREISRLRIRPGRVAAQFSMNRYWLRGGDSILSAQVIDAPNLTLSGFQYLDIDRDFRLVRRIDAKEAAVLPGGTWLLRGGQERRFDADLQPAPFQEKKFAFPETIQGFIDGETSPKEMNYRELSGYVRESRNRGYNVGRYEVDLHAKFSYPLLNVIIGLIAIPMALRAPRTVGLWRSVGTGLLIGFICWMALAASLSMGRKGLLPPIAAAWLPDLLFALAGVLLLRRRHA
jgi:lipopolysaccharide export system permease protein